MKIIKVITKQSEIADTLNKIGSETLLSANSKAIIVTDEKLPTNKEMMEAINQIDKTGASKAKIYKQERDALIEIYESANGKRWYNNTNWCSDEKPVSEWHGIDVDPEYVFVTDNKTVGTMGSVTSIDLSRNNIYCGKLEDNGRISPRIKELTQLKYINFSYNFIHGIIPEELYELKELEELYLHFNQLNCTISGKIGQMKKLRIIQLDHNHLTGPIPSTLGNLSDLETLCLHVNNLDNGYILVRLKSQINKPALRRNSTSIPASIAKLTKLTKFMAYQNQLTGSIPNAIKQHPNYSHWQLETQQNNVKLK